MEKTRQPTTLKRFFTSRLFLFIAIPAIILAAVGLVRSFYTGYKIDQEILGLESEIKSLQKKRLESMEILKYVMSDAFVEAKARTELNLKRPEEKVLVVTNQERRESGEIVNSAPSRQSLSNPVKWWYYFTRHALPEAEDF